MKLEIRETHVSWLVFDDLRVYKVKKAVDLGFVDHTSREARFESCRAEIALNGRLAPDVYEGLGRFSGPDGSVEPVVVMRRLPADRSLSNLAGSETRDLVAVITELAQLLGRFHADARRGPEIDAECTASAIRSLWDQTLTQIACIDPAALPGSGLDQIARLARRYLAGRQALLEERISAGHAVEGHGDLLADDIFVLDDGIRILDCLEFDERLRAVDRMSDLGSLLMDLERLGRQDLSELLLASYRLTTRDDCPSSLVEHFIAYRAAVRAKVALLQGRPEATGLLKTALHHLEQARVRLVLIGGLPGCGKTTLATGLAARTGWTVLSTDAERRALAGGGPPVGPPPGFGTGLYQPGVSDQVYERVLAETEQLLARGRSVILDGTWYRQAWRERAAQVAATAKADMHQMKCDIPVRVALSRISRRQAGLLDLSEATPGTHLALRNLWEPWSQARSLDGTLTPDRLVGEALAEVGYQPMTDRRASLVDRSELP